MSILAAIGVLLYRVRCDSAGCTRTVPVKHEVHHGTQLPPGWSTYPGRGRAEQHRCPQCRRKRKGAP